MIAGNRALHLPPWHPLGFGASEELVQRAARLIVCEYALPQNFKLRNLGCLSAPDEGSNGKKWIKGFPPVLLSDIEYRINHQVVADQLRSGKYCLGIAHADFSNLFVLDLDHPGPGDAEAIMESLTEEGWHFKQFDSGKGRHFWVFFTDLPVKLLSKYKCGVAAMREVARRFVAKTGDSLQGKIDIRGCGKALIKLPLQFDPHYEWVILPFDDRGVLITDFADAVDFAADIRKNDSSQLIDWLESHSQKIDEKPEKTAQRSPALGKPGKKPGKEIEVSDWLRSVRVGPGESNDFIRDAVYKCWIAGMSKDETTSVLRKLYDQEHPNGRVTCKDTWPQWRSKIDGQWQWLIGNYEKPRVPKQVEFFEGDLTWIRKHARLEADPLFLGIHLWARRKCGKDVYFLSRPTAKHFGLSAERFRSATRRFRRSGLVEVVSPGRVTNYASHAPRATEYKLTDYPVPEGPVLSGQTPLELAAAYFAGPQTHPKAHPPASTGGNTSNDGGTTVDNSRTA
jgi:hypothetical protein